MPCWERAEYSVRKGPFHKPCRATNAAEPTPTTSAIGGSVWSLGLRAKAFTPEGPDHRIFVGILLIGQQDRFKYESRKRDGLPREPIALCLFR